LYNKKEYDTFYNLFKDRLVLNDENIEAAPLKIKFLGFQEKENVYINNEIIQINFKEEEYNRNIMAKISSQELLIFR